MLFSIITVNLNNLAGLKETISSILAQSFLDYEIIVVDGGSTDGSKEYIESIKNNKISFLYGPDNGIYDAMNKGIKYAKGEYYLFINSGDCLAGHDTLEKIASSINGADMLYGDTIIVSEDGKKEFYKRAREFKWKIYLLFTHHQSIAYKSEVIKNKSIQYDQNYKVASDYAFTLKFVEQARNIKRVSFPISKFRLGGISSKSFLIGIKENYLIRKKYINCNFLINLSLTIVSICSNLLRRYLKYFYRIIRYK